MQVIMNIVKRKTDSFIINQACAIDCNESGQSERHHDSSVQHFSRLLNGHLTLSRQWQSQHCENCFFKEGLCPQYERTITMCRTTSTNGASIRFSNYLDNALSVGLDIFIVDIHRLVDEILFRVNNSQNLSSASKVEKMALHFFLTSKLEKTSDRAETSSIRS